MTSTQITYLQNFLFFLCGFFLSEAISDWRELRRLRKIVQEYVDEFKKVVKEKR